MTIRPDATDARLLGYSATLLLFLAVLLVLGGIVFGDLGALVFGGAVLLLTGLCDALSKRLKKGNP